jgi:hypothetical protein
MKTLQIVKLTDREYPEDASYYTLDRLRENVINVWYDTWGEDRENDQTHTKEQIASSDDEMLEYLNNWGYDTEFILTLTEKDFSYLLTN